MNCAHCKSVIDDDSYFCDQCGQEITVCPACGATGKGKRCTQDGKPLITARERAEGGGASATPTAGGATAAPTLAGAGQLFLVNSNIGVNLEIKPGQTIGRSSGEHASVFSAYPMISGTHARIDVGQGWSVTDLGSTNGTMVNGQPAAPNTPVPLADQAVVKFGNVEFIVRISGGGATSATSTVRM